MLPAHRLMVAHAAVVAAATTLYVTVPAARAPAWAVIGVAGVVAVLTGVRVHRPAHRWPWWLLAAGLLTFVAGDTYYNVAKEYFHASNLFPSPADACYLATYPLFAAGLYGLVRYRWAGRDLPSLLDALILTAGLALPVWLYLGQPLTEVDGRTWQEQTISVAYPSATSWCWRCWPGCSPPAPCRRATFPCNCWGWAR
ncbi:hypothetical protein [Streptomyces sp. MAI_2237]